MPEPRTGKRKDIHERALGLLAVRQRSRRELERRLVQAGFTPDDVQEELARLERVGLIDDEAFARAVVESRAGRRGESVRAITQRLREAGVAQETVITILDEAAIDEEAGAMRLAEQRASRLGGLAPPVAFQRLSSFLARRGYAPELARRAARRALGVESVSD